MREKVCILVLAASACGPDPITQECVSIDPNLGVQGIANWCDDALSVHDPEIMYEGQPPDGGQAVCVAPDPDGECPSRPLDEVTASIETPLREQLALNTPSCEVERWEIPCMRTIEGGMFSSSTNYCCYQVAYWGTNCG